jgi:hypothetical protein
MPVNCGNDVGGIPVFVDVVVGICIGIVVGL